MNRREFLKSAAAVATLGALTRVAAQTGIAPETAKSSEPKSDAKKVARRKFRDTDLTLPLLGYGMMRLPTKDGRIDREEAQKLVDTAMAAGINYFDTAEPYHDGESQDFAGEAFKKYPRDSYMLATKLPMWSIRTVADAENIFKGQLASCKTEYFDFYLVHALNATSFRTFEDLKLYDLLKKYQAEGKIKHLGFSFHDAPEVLESIVNAHEWEFGQIQLNFVDWDRQNAKRMYEFLTSKKIPVIVMEPLQGGRLAELTPAAVQVLKQADPKASAASWAFRYAGSLPNVVTVLSGMTTMDVLKENIGTFTDFKPLTDAERATLDKARDVYLNISDTVPCTACRYCAVCPVRIDIPAVFAVWNSFCEKKDEAAFKEAYNKLEVKAGACIGCRRCVRMCPQQIDIPTQLRKIAQAAGDNAGGGRGGRGGGRQGGGPGGGMGGFGGGMPGGMGGFGGGMPGGMGGRPGGR